MTNWNSESSSNLPKDPQLVSDKTGILIEYYVLYKICFFYFAGDKNLNQLKQEKKVGRKWLLATYSKCGKGRERAEWSQHHKFSHCQDSLGFFSTSPCKWTTLWQTGSSEKSEIWLRSSWFILYFPVSEEETLIHNPRYRHCGRIFPGWIEWQVYP